MITIAALNFWTVMHESLTSGTVDRQVEFGYQQKPLSWSQVRHHLLFLHLWLNHGQALSVQTGGWWSLSQIIMACYCGTHFYPLVVELLPVLRRADIITHMNTVPALLPLICQVTNCKCLIPHVHHQGDAVVEPISSVPLKLMHCLQNSISLAVL